MRITMKLLMVSVLALTIAAPAAFAQAHTQEVSPLPVTEPLDVGGTILQPGDYVIRVVPTIGDRNRVQVLSPDLSKVYTTVLTVPHDLEPGEEIPNTTFVYFPAGEGQPRALRTWFAPNSAMQAGHDIVYEENRAKQLARLAEGNVVTYRGEMTDETPLMVVTPQQTIETYTWTAPAPRTQTTTTTTVTTAPMTSSVQSTPMEMPRTAGNTPLLALLGLAALGGAVAVRAARS